MQINATPKLVVWVGQDAERPLGSHAGCFQCCSQPLAQSPWKQAATVQLPKAAAPDDTDSVSTPQQHLQHTLPCWVECDNSRQARMSTSIADRHTVVATLHRHEGHCDVALCQHGDHATMTLAHHSCSGPQTLRLIDVLLTHITL